MPLYLLLLGGQYSLLASPVSNISCDLNLQVGDGSDRGGDLWRVSKQWLTVFSPWRTHRVRMDTLALPAQSSMLAYTLSEFYKRKGMVLLHCLFCLLTSNKYFNTKVNMQSVFSPRGFLAWRQAAKKWV